MSDVRQMWLKHNKQKWILFVRIFFALKLDKCNQISKSCETGKKDCIIVSADAAFTAAAAAVAAAAAAVQ